MTQRKTSLGPSDFTAKDYQLPPAPVCVLYLGNLRGLRLIPHIREQLILCVQFNLLYQSHLVPADLKTDSNIAAVALHQGSAGQGCIRLSQQSLQAGNKIGSKNLQELLVLSVNTKINHCLCLYPHTPSFLFSSTW